MTGQNVEEAFNSTIHAILLKRGIIGGTPKPSASAEDQSGKDTIQLRSSMELQQIKKERGENDSCC
jgi:hypothetical protein